MIANLDAVTLGLELEFVCHVNQMDNVVMNIQIVHQCFAPEVDADPVVSWKLVKGAMRMQTVIRSLVTELVLKRMRKVRWLTYEDTKMPMILSWSSE